MLLLSALRRRRRRPASRDGSSELNRSAEGAADAAGNGPSIADGAPNSAFAPAAGAQADGALTAGDNEKPRAAGPALPQLTRLSREGSMESVSLTDTEAEGAPPHFASRVITLLVERAQLCRGAQAGPATRMRRVASDLGPVLLLSALPCCWTAPLCCLCPTGRSPLGGSTLLGTPRGYAETRPHPLPARRRLEFSKAAPGSQQAATAVDELQQPPEPPAQSAGGEGDTAGDSAAAGAGDGEAAESQPERQPAAGSADAAELMAAELELQRSQNSQLQQQVHFLQMRAARCLQQLPRGVIVVIIP